jgi:hypothetical protein
MQLAIPSFGAPAADDEEHTQLAQGGFQAGQEEVLPGQTSGLSSIQVEVQWHSEAASNPASE